MPAKLYYVVPDNAHWGEEWATFCRCDDPGKACIAALLQQDSSVGDVVFTEAPRSPTIGTGTWVVYEISAIPEGVLKNVGAVPWSKIPRTDWVLQ